MHRTARKASLRVLMEAWRETRRSGPASRRGNPPAGDTEPEPAPVAPRPNPTLIGGAAATLD